MARRSAALLGTTFAVFASLCHAHLIVTSIYPAENLQPQDAMFVRGQGCGLSWDSGVPMKQTSVNEWSITLSTSKCTLQQVLLKVLINDAVWQKGANVLVNVPKGDSSVDIFPWFFTSKGRYEYRRQFYSPQLHNHRDLVVYLPPSYDENYLKEDYETLIMHDGQNLFNASTSFLGIAWMCQDTVNALVLEGNMEEIIIVGADNTVNRTDEYTYSYDPTVPGGGDGDTYLDFLQESVIPSIMTWYRVVPNAAQSQSPSARRWGILGSSLGGLISCYAGWTRPEVYNKAGCMSSSFWWNNEDFNNTVLNDGRSADDVVYYLDSGDAGPDDDDKTQTITVMQHYEAMGYKMGQNLFYYLDHGGRHSEQYWGTSYMVRLFLVHEIGATPQGLGSMFR